MANPTTEERLERLNKALAGAASLLDQSPAKWENNCEDAFSKFRLTCVHLQRERAALDSVQDKAGAWHFIVKFGKSRPFLADRCHEVLRILMASDLWMKEFAKLGIDPKDLPPDDAVELEKRLREVDPERGRQQPAAPPPAAGGYPAEDRGPRPAEPPVGTIAQPLQLSNMAVVVQRCTTAKVMVDERMQMWGEIGRGLVICVSFSKGAKVDAVCSAARFLLTAPLSLSSAGKDSAGARRRSSAEVGAEALSIVKLCKKGEKQGLLLMPQASLSSGLEKDNVGLEYSNACKDSTAADLYKAFTEALRTVGEELIGKAPGVGELRVVACNFADRQTMEMTSNGPFMHAFNF